MQLFVDSLDGLFTCLLVVVYSRKSKQQHIVAAPVEGAALSVLNLLFDLGLQWYSREGDKVSDLPSTFKKTREREEQMGVLLPDQHCLMSLLEREMVSSLVCILGALADHIQDCRHAVSKGQVRHASDTGSK